MRKSRLPISCIIGAPVDTILLLYYWHHIVVLYYWYDIVVLYYCCWNYVITLYYCYSMFFCRYRGMYGSDVFAFLQSLSTAKITHRLMGYVTFHLYLSTHRLGVTCSQFCNRSCLCYTYCKSRSYLLLTVIWGRSCSNPTW